MTTGMDAREDLNAKINRSLVAGSSGAYDRFDVAYLLAQFPDEEGQVFTRYLHNEGSDLARILDKYAVEDERAFSQEEMELAVIDLGMGPLGRDVPVLLHSMSARNPDAYRYVREAATDINSLPLDGKWAFLKLMRDQENWLGEERELALFLFEQTCAINDGNVLPGTWTRRASRIRKIISTLQGIDEDGQAARDIRVCLDSVESWDNPLQTASDLTEIFAHFDPVTHVQIKELVIGIAQSAEREKGIKKLKRLVTADSKIEPLSARHAQIFMTPGLELSEEQLGVFLNQTLATLNAMNLTLQNLNEGARIEFIGEWLNRGGGLEVFGEEGTHKVARRYSELWSIPATNTLLDNIFDGAARSTVERTLPRPTGAD